MFLRDVFKNSKKIVAEGGNVSSASPGWQGAADQEAEEIDLKIHNRDHMVGQLRTLLAAQNESFKAAYGKYIWDPKLLASGQMFSGSSLQFFDVKGVNTQDFLNKLKKTKVGDIDTQIDQDMGDEVTAWLKSIIGKKVGNGTFLGFNSSLSSIWLLDDPQVRVQVDYELGPYDPKTKAPTEWFAYSHSSHYDDMAAGIKGVFHKYINRALTHSQASTKYVARVLKKGVKISDAPVTDSDYSFAVSSAQGGGMSVKYKPYVDPATGQPMEKDGVPVMQQLDPKDRDYIQNLDQQFQINFGRKRTAADQKLQGSFVGTIQLMNKAFTPEQNEAVARAFLDILFGPGSQMITKDDPERDRDIKFAAIDAMLLGGEGNKPLSVPNGKGLRQEAVDMAMNYANAFKAKAAGKAPVNEAEVKAQLRKGMPHLRDLKPADFLDLVDELHDGNGAFKLQNIPLNVKIDGFGGRFGKNAEGKPFMGTSRTEPKYQAGFVKYHQEKGTTDPEILGRAANFDKLFDENMAAIKLIDSKLGPDFLVDKQVTCEVLFLPFATATDEGKLKFVGIEYDQLPKGVDLVLVPYRIVQASTGEDLPNGDELVQQIAELGQSGNVMFMSNRLLQKDGLDVTEIINPLDNIEELKQIVSDTAGKRDRASLELRREVEAKLKPVQIALEKAIDEDPNIIGKDMLGQDYEGIVINSRLGPIKVTSQRQKDIITQKNAARAAARAEQPRENSNKTAVVAIGSFVGHRGHEELFDYTIKKAASVGGDPYLFIGNAVGKDDPIPPDVKVQTWHKMYPQYAKNIGTVQQGGSLLQKIKHELINPLPGKPPRYDNIIIMVGEDQQSMPIAGALMKAVNKFQGYEHVKASLEATPRGTGMSFTKLRNILKDPNATPEQQYAVWAQGFDEQKLGKDWILHLMDISRKGMGITTQQPTQPAVQKPVAERLSNALIRPRKPIAELSSEKLGQYKKAAGAQASAADKVGDTKKADKRFSGIVKATKKQFANDEKATEANVKTPQSYNKPRWWDDLPAKEREQFFKGQGKRPTPVPKKKEQGVEEGRPIGVSSGPAKPEALAKRAEWQRTPLASNKIVVDGFTINFTPDALIISKGGKVLWKKEGDYSQPTNSTLAGAKKLVTGLSRQGQPDEKQMFGKTDPAELQARKEHRKKWTQASNLASEKKITFQQAWKELFGDDLEEAKKKGADGKACWKGYKYAGTKNGKDKCVPISEDVESIMGSLIENIIANEFLGFNFGNKSAKLFDPKQQPIKVGSSGPDVKKVQWSLNTLGHKVGAIDGQFGPNTATGTKNFQKIAGLAIDGIVDGEVFVALNKGLQSKGVTEFPASLLGVPATTAPSTKGNTTDKPIAAVVKGGAGFTDVKTADGEVQRRQGVRNWRNNNPGNIRKGKFAISKGAIGDDGAFAVFPTLDAGLKAKEALVFGPTYINLSIRDAIARYAPPSENNTDMYIQRVVDATGASPDTLLAKLNSSQRDSMLSAINKVEGFKVGQIIPVNGTDVA